METKIINPLRARFQYNQESEIQKNEQVIMGLYAFLDLLLISQWMVSWGYPPRSG